MDYCIVLSISGLTGYIVSPLCMVIHLYKFFAAEKEQNLPSKNLASYCIGTAFAYALTLVTFIVEEPSHLLLSLFIFSIYNVAVLLFSMTLDVFLCLRNSVKKFQRSAGPRRRTFVAYSIFSWGTSAIIFLLYQYLFDSSVHSRLRDTVTDWLMEFIVVVYIVCFALFATSLYYIRRRRIDDKRASTRDAVTEVKLYVRLTFITGATYVIWFFTWIFIWLSKHLFGMSFCDSNQLYISPFLPAFEGICIFFGFTLKKGMFENDSTKNRPKATDDTNQRQMINTPA